MAVTLPSIGREKPPKYTDFFTILRFHDTGAPIIREIRQGTPGRTRAHVGMEFDRWAK
jgi:hypothetical protein